MLGRILKEFYAKSPGYLKTVDCSKEVLNVLTGLGNQWIVMAQCFSLKNSEQNAAHQQNL